MVAPDQRIRVYLAYMSHRAGVIRAREAGMFRLHPRRAPYVANTRDSASNQPSSSLASIDLSGLDATFANQATSIPLPNHASITMNQQAVSNFALPPTSHLRLEPSLTRSPDQGPSDSSGAQSIHNFAGRDGSHVHVSPNLDIAEMLDPGSPGRDIQRGAAGASTIWDGVYPGRNSSKIWHIFKQSPSAPDPRGFEANEYGFDDPSEYCSLESVETHSQARLPLGV